MRVMIYLNGMVTINYILQYKLSGSSTKNGWLAVSFIDVSITDIIITSEFKFLIQFVFVHFWLIYFKPIFFSLLGKVSYIAVSCLIIQIQTKNVY